MPDAPAGEAVVPPADPAPADRAPAGGPPQGRGRSPGWREVLLIAGVILAVVFTLEVASALLPPVRDAFRGFPVTIAILVVGTLGLLLLGLVRRPRR